MIPIVKPVRINIQEPAKFAKQVIVYLMEHVLL